VRDLDRLRNGTYHNPNSPRPNPATQVHSHQRSAAGSPTMSSTTNATAHPTVTTMITSWSLASSGGGGLLRSPT
jgi:hypothetical protein